MEHVTRAELNQLLAYVAKQWGIAVSAAWDQPGIALDYNSHYGGYCVILRRKGSSGEAVLTGGRKGAREMGSYLRGAMLAGDVLSKVRDVHSPARS